MKKNSLWLDGIKVGNVNPLKSDKEVDVLIIGGGITGMSTAYHLCNSKLKVCLVDQDLVGHGVTSKTTGKLTFLQELIYTKLSKEYSYEIAKTYLKSQQDAIKMVEKIIKDNKIECDFKKTDSYIFTDKIKEIDKIKEERNVLEKLNVKVKEHNELPFNMKCYSAISVSNTAVFHPIKYLMALKNICLDNNIEIYERTKIIEIKKEDNYYNCFTEKNKIKAKKVVLACHYPFFIFPFLFPIKGYLERSYVSASKVSDTKDFSAINVSKNTKSCRYHKDDYFIYLNGSHSLDRNYNVKEGFDNLVSDLEKFKLKPNYIWTNQDIITNDHLPYIGVLEDNLIIGTGYNTWGMTNGSLAGKIISDIILGKKNEYISLFDPKRHKPLSNILSVANSIFCSVKPFIENKIFKNKSFYPDNVRFETKNGKAIAIYTDSNGKEHVVYNKCPHLKCSLVFNEVERTWDCPCHGSRFDIDGNCIEGPSSYDITYRD